MAKKIRFPLEMGEGIEVRTLDELREHFTISSVLSYLETGKLLTWLRDRYEDGLAEALENLDLGDAELAARVCEIFEVEVDLSAAEDMEAIQERNRKIELLKESDADEKFFDFVDQVAFTQDELYDLLDDGQTTIYLCGDSFSIPLGKKGITYIGINQPIARIASKTVVDWTEKEIALTDVRLDDTYMSLLKEANCAQENREKVFLICKMRQTYINRFREGETSMVDCLVEVDMTTGCEHVIDNFVTDFYEYDDEVFYVKKTNRAFVIDEYQVFRYSKGTRDKVQLSAELENITKTSRLAMHSAKIWPQERSVCVSKNKIVFWSDWKAFAVNHDGTNKQELSACGDPMTPITLYNNLFYYLNRDWQRKGNNKQLCCYDLTSRENKKFADEAWAAAYYKDKLYYVALEGKMEDATRCWKIYELNMQSQVSECIYKSSGSAGTPSALYVENDRLGYKDNYGEDQGYIKTID